MALNHMNLFHVTGMLEIKTEMTADEIHTLMNSGDQDEVVKIVGKHDHVGQVTISIKRRCFVACVTREEAIVQRPKVLV